MATKLSITFVFIIFVYLPLSILAQNNVGADKYFRNALKRVRTEFKVPALGGVLVLNGKIIVAGSYGERSQGSGDAVNDNDRFPIGSISKTFTGFVAARLTQPNNFVLGTLTWDTKVREVFPNIMNVAGIYPEYQERTIGDFTTHQSDLPNDSIDESSTCDRDIFNDYMVCGRNQHMVRSMKRPPEPGTIYSNIGPVMVANMAQRRTGKTWEELVQQYIFTPLNISAGFISSVNPSSMQDPLWHLESGAMNTPVAYSDNDKYNIAAPSGHVIISPKDMGKYLIELMPGAANRIGALKTATLNEYLERYNIKRNVTRGGWFMENLSTNNLWPPGEKVLSHNGSHNLNFAEAKLLPNAKVAFCAMTNAGCQIDICGMSRGKNAVDKLNDHLRHMWYNSSVLPFFDDLSPFSITTVSRTGALPGQLFKLKDMDMLSTWKAAAPGSTLILNTNAPLTAIKGLILVYHRNRPHNIKTISISAAQGVNNEELLVTTENEVGKDHSIFEFEPAIASSKLRVKFENLPNKSTEIAEVLFLYDDPLNRMTNKLSLIKAMDKRVIQPPVVLRAKSH